MTHGERGQRVLTMLNKPGLCFIRNAMLSPRSFLDHKHSTQKPKWSQLCVPASGHTWVVTRGRSTQWPKLCPLFLHLWLTWPHPPVTFSLRSSPCLGPTPQLFPKLTPPCLQEYHSVISVPSTASIFFTASEVFILSEGRGEGPVCHTHSCTPATCTPAGLQ
jgi:hypothetical protein